MIRLIVLLTGVAAMMSAYADAQPPRYGATYGQTTLEAGFEPNPFTVSLTAGGTLDASELGDGCTGLIAIAPDFRVDYRSDGSALTVAADSVFDTVLVVHGPDGNWHCDDDSAGGNDPRIVFDDPAEGEYAIWVGAKDGDARAVLQVSETR
ncbi:MULTISPECIES: peptidase S1 [Hyphobacterium]|uniref:Peptidase S1 n=1 Tax=Hyphobacterium vulgare TaxID=1736751 RepID=A0ABV6ZZN4_9PROT